MKKRKTTRGTDDEATPDLGELVRQITSDNLHPTMDEGEVGKEITEYDDDEELKRLIEDRLDQPEIKVDTDELD